MRRLDLAMSVLVYLLIVAVTVPATAASKVKDLPEKYQIWLEDVDFIISKKERKAFLSLEKDYQRDSFVREFWEARDPDPATPDNPFKGKYLARLEEARERYETKIDDRLRVYALNGEPGTNFETSCGRILWPLEFWVYNYSEHANGRLVLVFYQRFDTGASRLWQPQEGYEALLVNRSDLNNTTMREYLFDRCTETRDVINTIANTLEQYLALGESEMIAATRRPVNEDSEWLATFHAFSTEVEPDRSELQAVLAIEFPGRHQQRTIVRGVFRISAEAAKVQELADRRSFNFALTGEVLRDDELFDSFKYIFDVPELDDNSADLPLVFERWLRPGEYRIVVKLEDIIGGGVFREEQTLVVPIVGEAPASELTSDVSETAEVPPAETSIRLVGEGKDLQRGYARFSAQLDGGEPEKVSFFVEGERILTKTRPPFSVDLSLGDLPEAISIRAVAYDGAGNELATDEVLLNAGDYAFVLRLVEPRSGSKHVGSVRVRAAVETPADGDLDRVEFYRNDDRVAALYQPPYAAEIQLEGEGVAVIRAVAHLTDGNSTEAVSIINGGEFLENVDVRLVEVFATVLDAKGRPLQELDRASFRVLEDGTEQEILRFEQLKDLPIYAALLIDTSASMAERIAPVKDAAVRFFDQAIRPKDRAAVITFDEKPRMAAAFTSDLTTLTGALAGLRAGRGTALYDSLLFSLYAFRGLKGQRALLLLSDGEDRRSKATFAEVREFALRSGVTVYAIGLRQGMTRRGKGELTRLAEETGGRAFLIEKVEELDTIYEQIQTDLRSRYFLAYQPSRLAGEGFRTIEVQVDQTGAEVRALRGYLPR